MSRRVVVELASGKTVELCGFNVSGSCTVSMVVRMVELGIEIPFVLEFSDYVEWKQANSTKTWRDYVRPRLLAVYDSYALAKTMKELLESEAS